MTNYIHNVSEIYREYDPANSDDIKDLLKMVDRGEHIIGIAEFVILDKELVNRKDTFKPNEFLELRDQNKRELNKYIKENHVINDTHSEDQDQYENDDISNDGESIFSKEIEDEEDELNHINSTLNKYQSQLMKLNETASIEKVNVLILYLC